MPPTRIAPGPGFVGLKIQSLDDIIKIASNLQHKPGLYIETKEPKQFPGIEADLKNKLLDKAGHLRRLQAGQEQHRRRPRQGPRGVANVRDRQPQRAAEEMPNTPKILLLWVGEGSIEPKSVTFAESGEPTKAAYYAKQEPKDFAEFEKGSTKPRAWAPSARALRPN